MKPAWDKESEGGITRKNKKYQYTSYYISLESIFYINFLRRYWRYKDTLKKH